MLPINFNPTTQAQLIIGPEEQNIIYTKALLNNIFCKNNSCKTCIVCKQIEENKYSKIIWLKPEKQYTLDDIEIIFNKISFTLDDDEKFFIILEKADFLGINCSNKLLKSIEEPKKGYYFFLLAQRENLILPTIKSRCTITTLYSDNKKNSFDEFHIFFINIKNSNPEIFLKTLEKINPNEQDSLENLDFIFNYWIQENKTALLENNIQKYKFSSLIIKVLSKALEQPPMPGSSKIFWKNLYITLKTKL